MQVPVGRWKLDLALKALGLDLEIIGASPKKYPYQLTFCREHPADAHRSLSPFCPHVACICNSINAHASLLKLP